MASQNTKSGYDTRFGLLHLAKEILETNAHIANNAKPRQATFYTVEQVIETAKELNKFVSQK